MAPCNFGARWYLRIGGSSSSIVIISKYIWNILSPDNFFCKVNRFYLDLTSRLRVIASGCVEYETYDAISSLCSCLKAEALEGRGAQQREPPACCL
jgi:hypothetical protein